MGDNSWDFRRFIFWAILAFAAVVRFKGLSEGLPLHTLYGESDTYNILKQMLFTGDLNPHQFAYPGLAYYIHLPFQYIFYFIGVLSGHFNVTTSIPEASLIFVGRLVCAALGTLSVYIVGRIGKIFSDGAGLVAMAVLAAVPQHIEFSRMLRPEVPSMFFALLSQYWVLRIPDFPKRACLLAGLFAGASFSTKYNVGLPLILTLIGAYWIYRRSLSWKLLLGSALCFAGIFAVTNPFLLANPDGILFWIRKVDSFYLPAEEYYGRNIVTFYIDFLIRYNYKLPLMLFSLIGLVLSVARKEGRAIILAIYPTFLFLWICSFETRRVHALLPLHPYFALWAGLAFHALWQWSFKTSVPFLFKTAYTILLAAVLFLPYHRAGTLAYLFSRTDNRSKAELWITNQLPQGSKIALLQFHQIELDTSYFEVENFNPRDYVAVKDFQWFADHGFDYVVLSSGQYMRYFVEGSQAEKFKNYFLRFFDQAGRDGTLVLDLVTHPVSIPDYRIKVYSTKPRRSSPAFVPAVREITGEFHQKLRRSGTSLSLAPGYYSLEIPSASHHSPSIEVRNLKLDESILRKNGNPALSAATAEERIPFAIFPARLTSHFQLFTRLQADVLPNQHVEFRWEGIKDGIQIREIQPPLNIVSVQLQEISDHRHTNFPYILFDKEKTLTLKCTLLNKSDVTAAGHVEAFLSEIGVPQPWKEFSAASNTQEFVLDPNQSITIDIPIGTNDLTGDYQLSYWIFTRADLPFSPQNGGWFNKQIRILDEQLGVHPIYRIAVP